MSMFDIQCRCNRSLSLLSPTVLRYGVFNRFIPDAGFSTSVNAMAEVAPKINNLRMLGKKSVSAKFKVSIMPSGGPRKVKLCLHRLFSLFLILRVFLQLCYLIFFPKNYTIISILNENVSLHLSFRDFIFVIKSSQ